MKVKDLYALPSKPLEAWCLNPAWLGIDDTEDMSSTIVEIIDASKQLDLREIAHHENKTGCAFTLYSLSWEGQPFMLVQNAGRRGPVFENSWITDEAAYKQAKAYVFDLFNGDEDPVITDPEKEIYPDEFLDFSGHNFCPEFGFESQEPELNVCILGEANQFTDDPELSSYVLIRAEAGIIPAATLRNDFRFFSCVRPLTAVESKDKPRLLENGEATYYWYQRCARVMSLDVMRI